MVYIVGEWLDTDRLQYPLPAPLAVLLCMLRKSAPIRVRFKDKSADIPLTQPVADFKVSPGCPLRGIPAPRPKIRVGRNRERALLPGPVLTIF